MDILLNYFVENYISLISIFGMLFTLIVYPLKNKKLQVTMLITLGLLFLLTIAVYVDEYLAKTFTTHTPFRTLFSYLNYTLKVACIGSLLLIFTNKKNDYIVIIGATLVNDLVYMLMFFTKWVVWFDEQNIFQKGPLQLFFFLPSALYLAMLIREFYLKKRVGRFKESAYVFAIASFILLAVVIELATEIMQYTLISIVLACIFYFIEVYASNEQNDAVTGLFNRKCYSSDITKRWKRIECVISADLNNLKQINDEFGHEAGDAALHALGECLDKRSLDYSEKFGRAFVAYRVGGDEMSVLVYQKFNKKLDVETVELFIKEIQEEVRSKGYSVACGYAINDKSRLVNEILDLADKNMYSNKKEMKCKCCSEEKTDATL